MIELYHFKIIWKNGPGLFFLNHKNILYKGIFFVIIKINIIWTFM